MKYTENKKTIFLKWTIYIQTVSYKYATVILF